MTLAQEQNETFLMHDHVDLVFGFTTALMVKQILIPNHCTPGLYLGSFIISKYLINVNNLI